MQDNLQMRAPTIDEIRKLLEYPDRRIKPIVYTMISSGIRLGGWDYLKWKHIRGYGQNQNEGRKLEIDIGKTIEANIKISAKNSKFV